MSWEKIGVTVVSRPVAHGAGIYMRIPKAIVEAYELFTADAIELTIDRALRRLAEASSEGQHKNRSVEVMDQNTSPKKALAEGSLQTSDGPGRRRRPRTSEGKGGQST